MRGSSVSRTTDRVSVRSRYLVLRLSAGGPSGTDGGFLVFKVPNRRPVALDVQNSSFSQSYGASLFFSSCIHVLHT